MVYGYCEGGLVLVLGGWGVDVDVYMGGVLWGLLGFMGVGGDGVVFGGLGFVVWGG